MRRFLFIIISFFTLLFVSVTPAEALLKFEGRYWFSNLDSQLRVSDAGITGTDINLIDDLGVDEKKNFLEGRITYERGNHKLRYGYIPMSWDGKKSITQSINFAGKTYSLGTQVDTSLDVTYHRFGYEYDFINTMGNRLGIIIEMKFIDAEARLKAPSLGFDQVTTAKAPIPTLGIGFEVALPLLFSLGGEVTGITAGSKGYLVDGEAAVNFNSPPFLTVSGGYRFLDVKFERSKTGKEANFTLKGPFLMVKGGF